MAPPIDLQFLSKISDSLGYLVIQDGTIFKSDGELVNSERIALLAQKIVSVGVADALVPGEKFSELSIHYPTFYFTIYTANNGATIFVVKRKANGSTNPMQNSTMHLLD